MSKKDLKKETGIATEGAAVKDKVAYKQCVDQQKRQQSANPWAMCNKQFGVGKSEESGIQPGMSFNQLKKKDNKSIKTDYSNAKKIKAAQKEHAKPSHPQTKPVGVKNPQVKAPVFKSELFPGQSWAQLQKMQSEEPLQKPKK
jgi:hypothetical protein